VSATAVGSGPQAGVVPRSERSPSPPAVELAAAGAEVGWRDAAACRGAPTAEFFGRRSARVRGRARCEGCVVAEVCLWWAIVAEVGVGYRYGVWGGLSPARRSKVAADVGADGARANLVAVLGELNNGAAQRRAVPR
jgi:Transcription factor WhiB